MIFFFKEINFEYYFQEEEAAQSIEDKTESSEVGWEDSEFQPLDDFQPLEQSGTFTLSK